MIGKVANKCGQGTDQVKRCHEAGPSSGNPRRRRQCKSQLEGQRNQINKGGQKHEINIPELSYWKPLSSNRVFKGKKDNNKIKIIEGSNER